MEFVRGVVIFFQKTMRKFMYFLSITLFLRNFIMGVNLGTYFIEYV